VITDRKELLERQMDNAQVQQNRDVKKQARMEKELIKEN